MKTSIRFAVFAIAVLTAVGCATDKGVTPDPQPNNTISGTVSASSPTTATQGVRITLNSVSVLTDVNSAFRFDSVADGSYVVTPELAGRTFTPINRTVTMAGASIAGIDFTLVDEKPINQDSIAVVRIQAGTFRCGNENGQPNISSAAVPEHTVTLTRNYIMGKYEITQRQWARIMSYNHSAVQGEGLPVTMVSVDSIIAFCNRLSLLDGLQPVYTGEGINVRANMDADGYRLPTEAEWEFAAAGGDTTLIYGVPDEKTGSVNNDAYQLAVDEYAWYEHSLLAAGKPQEPQPGGGKKPNGYGLFDMSGNVDELVYGRRIEYTSEPKVDPYVEDPLPRVSLRGGHTHDDVAGVSVRSRERGLEINRTYLRTGFRVVRTVP